MNRWKEEEMQDRDGQPAVRVLMMPRETNGQGTIFGGVLLSYIDQAGAVEAQRLTNHRVVTVAMKEVVFLKPVFVGDVVSFYTSIESVGRTSITTRVSVQVTRVSGRRSHTVDVTEAIVVYVAINEQGQPIPVDETGAERDAAAKAD